MAYTVVVSSFLLCLPLVVLAQSPEPEGDPPNAPLRASFAPRVPPTLKVRGGRAPKALRLYKGTGGFALDVVGPARVNVRLYALTLRRGGPPSYPVTVRVDDRKTKLVTVPGQARRSWTLSDHPLLGLAPAKAVAISLGPGKHRIRIKPAANIMLGIAVSVRVRRSPPSTTRPLAMIEDPNEPGLRGPDGEVAPAGPAAGEEPDATGPVPPTDGLDSAGDRAASDTEPVAPQVPKPRVIEVYGARLLDPPAAMSIAGPESDPVPYYPATSEVPLLLEVEGPRRLALRLRALGVLGEETPPEPHSLAVLIDDVMGQSIDVAPPTSTSPRVVGANYVASEERLATIDVPAGSHRIALVASDNTVAGIGVAFGQVSAAATAPTTTATTVLDAASAAPMANRIEPAAFAGFSSPFGLGSAGYGLWLQAQLALSGIDPHLFVGFEVGVTGTQYSTPFAHDGRRNGRATLKIVTRAIPLALSASYRLNVAPLIFDVGAGAGVLLQSVSLNTSGRRRHEGAMAVFGMLHAAAAVDVGPGAMVVRTVAIGSPRTNGELLREQSGGALLLMVGYRIAVEF